VKPKKLRLVETSKSLPPYTYRGYIYPKSTNITNDIEMMLVKLIKSINNPNDLIMAATIKFKHRCVDDNDTTKYAIEITFKEN